MPTRHRVDRDASSSVAVASPGLATPGVIAPAHGPRRTQKRRRPGTRAARRSSRAGSPAARRAVAAAAAGLAVSGATSLPSSTSRRCTARTSSGALPVVVAPTGPLMVRPRLTDCAIVPALGRDRRELGGGRAGESRGRDRCGSALPSSTMPSGGTPELPLEALDGFDRLRERRCRRLRPLRSAARLVASVGVEGAQLDQAVLHARARLRAVLPAAPHGPRGGRAPRAAAGCGSVTASISRGRRAQWRWARSRPAWRRGPAARAGGRGSPGGLYSQCQARDGRGNQPCVSPRRNIHLCTGDLYMSTRFWNGRVLTSWKRWLPWDMLRSTARPSVCDENDATAVGLPARAAAAWAVSGAR